MLMYSFLVLFLLLVVVYLFVCLFYLYVFYSTDLCMSAIMVSSMVVDIKLILIG